MKRLKFLLLTVVCVAVLFCVATVTASADVIASGDCGEHVAYILDTDGTLTISGTGAMTYFNYGSVPWDLKRELIKNVIIDEGVTTIAPYAFTSCSKLTTISIPKSITVSNWMAFEGCDSLTSVYITDVTAWCNIIFDLEYSNPLNYANNLYLNGSLVSDLTIPNEITKINAYSFCGCTSLKSVTIENKECQIAYNEKTIPSSATIYGYGGSSAEVYAKLYDRYFVSLTETDSEIVAGGYISDYIVWWIDNNGTLTVSGTGSMPDYNDWVSVPWYSYRNNIKKVIIEDNITSIGRYVFKDIATLTSVTIPDSVTSIGSGAFFGCSSLKSISIPDCITSIGWSAFDDCMSLASVCITDLEKWLNIKFDGSSANPCYNGANLYLNGEIVKEITIPSSVNSLGNYAFYGCTSLTIITIPNGVTSIGMATFMSCSSLRSINIPDSVTSIGTHAFSCCSSLVNIDIPDGVTSIGESTFYNCSSLVSVNIPDSVSIIGSSAFYGCEKLLSIVIPDGVTSIGKFTFASCKNLSIVILGDNVALIKEYAFANCYELQEVGYPKDKTIKETMVIEANNEKLVNAKWYYNVCKNTHQYDGACDAICNICEFPREVNALHTYTNSCDDTCNICGYITAISHTYTDDCDSICNICSFEREIVYDYTITTDEDITLSYSTTANVRFVVSDETIAYITGTGMSSVVIGSYVSKTVSATITPKKPGGVIVSVVDSYDNVLAKSLLLVVEGEHQFELSKTISVRDCVTPGKAVYVCKFCAFEKEENEEAYGHSYSYGCDSICNRCDFVRTDISHDNTKSVAEVKATCTTKGSTAGVYCNDCAKYISGHAEIPVDTNAHKWDNGAITTTATCKVSGVKTYTCQYNAFHIKTENLGINASNHINTKNVAAVKATCTTKGYTAGVYCNDCQKYISGHAEIPVDTNAHNWDNGKITTVATCKVSGVKTYTCQHNSSHKKTENLGINASKHVNTKNVAEVKATCTTKGYTAGVYCNDCQKYISGHKEIAVNTTNHVNTKKVPETPATFENVGYTAGVYCNDCKKYISGHVEIPKLVPEFTDSKDAKESGNNIISNNGLTVAQLLSQAGKGAVIKTADGKAVGNAALIGTGMVLTMADGSKKEIVVYGDSDGDGKISAADARLALRASVKLESYKEDSCYYKAANVDKDALTAADARLILRASVGLEEPKDWMK